MQLLNTLLSFMLLLTSSMVFGASIIEAKGLTTVPGSGVLEFRGDIGGHFIEYNGTIQQILDYTERVHPHFNRVSLLNSDDLLSEHPLAKREQQPLPAAGDGIICCPVPGQPWRDAKWHDIAWQTLHYLWAINRNLEIGAGPGKCVRVSCMWNAGIHWCNDNKEALSLSSRTVALYAANLASNCFGDGSRKACGQIFHNVDSRWNIFVTRDSC